MFNLSQLTNELFPTGMHALPFPDSVLPFALRKKLASVKLKCMANTNWLSQVRICCSTHPNGGHIITESMQLVSTKIESFGLVCWQSGCRVYMLGLRAIGSLAMFTPLSLTLQLLSIECRACVCLKIPYGNSKRLSDIIHDSEYFVSVHP